MEPEWVKRVKENLKKVDIKPVFADEVLVMGMVKVRREGEKVSKEGIIRLIFTDVTTAKPISVLVITLSTAKGLVKALQNQINKIEENLGKTTTTTDLTYIG